MVATAPPDVPVRSLPDILAVAVDAQGNTTDLAVEVSCTGDVDDADRARSHAALMQRRTKIPLKTKG